MLDSDTPVCVSVGIVVFNTDPVLLRECIDSIRSQQGANVGDVEILVQDNSSNAELRSEFQSYVDHWSGGPNVGFATAANELVVRAKHQWMMLLNPDARLEPGSLASLIDLTVAPGANRTIYCGWLISQAGIQVDAMMNWVFSTSRFVRRRRYVDYLERASERPTVEIQKVSGGACFAMRATLLSLGPYDERFFLYGEDADMSFRAARSGLKLVGVPAARVGHSAASSQVHHSRLVEAARADAALRLASYRLGWLGSILFRIEFALVTIAGATVAARTSSRSVEARLARLRVIREWGLRNDMPKWDPSCLK